MGKEVDAHEKREKAVGIRFISFVFALSQFF